MNAINYSSTAIRGIWKTLKSTPLPPNLYQTIKQLNICQIRPTRRGCRGGAKPKLQSPLKPQPIETLITRSRANKATLTSGVNINNLIPIETSKIKQPHTTCKPPKDAQPLPSILSTNCRSLNQAKLSELELIANTKNADCLCLTETWWDDNKEHAFNLPNYSITTSNRKSSRVGGGVAIFHKQSMNMSKIGSFTSETLSALWMMLRRVKSQPIIIGCIYHPPAKIQADNNTTLEYIITTMEKLSTKHKKAQYIICGDFNHLDMSIISDSYNLKQLVTFNTRASACLDLIYTDIPEYQKTPAEQLAPLLKNDHCCVFLPHAFQKRRQFHYKLKRQYSPSVKNRIGVLLAQQSWDSVLHESHVNDKVVKFHQIIDNILDTVCPVKKVRVRDDDPKWETSLTRKLRNCKNAAFKKGSATYHYFASALKQNIRKNKKQQVQTSINNLTNGDANWWKEMKKLTGKTKIQRDNHLVGEEWLDSQSLADKLNTYFVGVGGEPLDPSVIELEPTTMYERKTSEGLVKKKLSKIDISKSVHSRDFPPWISKNFAEDICTPLTDIINSMFAQLEFPAFWKQAEVVPLEKVPNPQVLKDYRPISLLFHCGKIAEHFFMAEYKKQVLPKIRKNQFAYQPRLGTVDALVYAIDNWTHLLDDKNTAAVNIMFKDFSKAFDCMQPELLKERLQGMEVTSDIIKLSQSFLSNRQQCVRVGNTKSTYLPVKVGVPQGTLSGPLFWLAFIDDYNIPNIATSKYADDISCYWPTARSETTETLSTVSLPTQQVSDCINYGLQWSKENSMTLNVSKTKLLPVSVKKECSYEGETTVEVVRDFKFLGVTIDEHLCFNVHIDNVTKKAKQRNFTLTMLKRMGVHSDKLTLFYISNIRSVMTYAAPCFYGFLSKKQIQELEGVQSFTTKMILPDIESYSERLKILDLPILSDFMHALCCNYFKKISSPNCDSILKDLVPSRRSNTDLRHSDRLKDTFVLERPRTKLRENSFIMKFSEL